MSRAFGLPALFLTLTTLGLVACSGGGSGSRNVPAPVSAAWLPTGIMVQARRGHTATLLLDGRVLIVGGTATTAELYDPVVGAFFVTGTPTVWHGQGATATRLANGRVLVVGGEWSPTTAEIFDPTGEIFTATGSTSSPHSSHTATTLPNGSILVASGLDPVSGVTLAESELYDPGMGTFSPTGSVNYGRARATATALPGGEVLLTGGSELTGFWRIIHWTAELYDPILGTFSFTGMMSGSQDEHTATLLPDGTVLSAGTFSSAGWGGGMWADIYDPGTGLFTPTAGAPVGRDAGQTATLLASGRVLLAGGYLGNVVTTNTAELYDPTIGTFAPTASMAEDREQHTATLLLDNRVLIVGGTPDWLLGPDLATAEVYQPRP